MSQWKVVTERTEDGRYRWRHVPAEGTGPGAAHAGGDLFATEDEARVAGDKALADHHEARARADRESRS